MIAVMLEYIRRVDAHPTRLVYDGSINRFVIDAPEEEFNEIIATEIVWYQTWVADVVEWMRSRVE